MQKVLVTRKIPAAGVAVLERAGFQITVNPEDRVLTKAELMLQVKGQDGVLCLLTDSIDREVIDAAEGVKIFSNYAVGYNNIDVAYATKKCIMVTNTPGVLTDATADLTWALMLSAARRLVEADCYTRAGEFKGWSPTLFLGLDVTGKTLGIIGAGRIGTAVGLRSVGFKMKILYYELPEAPNNIELDEIGAERVPLERLLRESDFITLHVPLTAQTRHLISHREFALMKPTACLINTSRGPVVNEEALVKALKEGKIACAGLDVYEHEPEIHPELMCLSNVVLLPHLGSATRETRDKMAIMAAENIVAALSGKRPPNLVNLEVWKE